VKKPPGTAPAAAAMSVRVSGRVQGVGFRYSCRAEARRLGLKGWVRNTPEGDVELWAESPSEEALEALLDWLRRGPPLSRVDEVRPGRVRPTGVYREFSIEP
jgi:acylphosphatase